MRPKTSVMKRLPYFKCIPFNVVLVRHTSSSQGYLQHNNTEFSFIMNKIIKHKGFILVPIIKIQ